MTDAIRSLFELLTKKEKSGSDYTGTVTRVEGKTAYVRFDGADIDDTPVALSIGASRGDSVRIRVVDGRAWLIGNDTAPPNDSSEVASDLRVTNNNLSVTNKNLTKTAEKVSSLSAANRIVTQELVAHRAVIDNLDANYASVTFANIDTANINTAKVMNLFTQVGMIRDAVIDSGKITGYLDAVKINAASIDAGTLSVDRLVIRGSTSSLVYAINNISGALQSQNVDTINGEVLTDRTILADKIVAHTITATEITAQNLVGTNGWINLSAGTFNYGVGKLVWDGSALTVAGTITAGAGSKIGPWNIETSSIWYGNSAYGNASGLYFGTSGLSLTDKFRVSAAGAMTATSGLLGNWNVETDRIWYGNKNYANAAGMYFGTSGLSLGSAFKVTPVGAVTATSGTIGNWKIDGSLKSNLPGYTTYIDPTVIYMGATGGGGATLMDGSLSISNNAATQYSIVNLQGIFTTGSISGASLTVSGDITVSGALNGKCTNYAGGTSMPVVSNSVDGNRVSTLDTPNGTTFRARAQWGATGTTYTWTTVTNSASDVRLKENVSDSESSGLDVIDRIKVRQFDWKQDGKHQGIGFVADELEEIDANLAVGGGYEDDGSMYIKSVNTFYLQGYEVKAIQELHKKTKELKAELEELKRRIA